MPGTSLDEMDRAILFYLQEDSRRSYSDIAEELGVSSNTVRNRISELEDAGVIAGYHVEVNYDTADVQHHYVFICSVPVGEREQLAAEVRELEGVTQVVTLMTGTNNMLIFGAADEKDGMTELAYAVDDLGLEIEHEHLIRDFVQQPYSGFEPPEHLQGK